MSAEIPPITQLVRDYIDPILKPAGFIRDGRVWNRSAPFGAHVLEIQSDLKRTDGSSRFTVNVGVFIDNLWSLCWERPKPAFIREVDCYPRFRLEFLTSGFNSKRRDKWWILNDTLSVTEVGREISIAMTSNCLPFFDSLHSIADVLKVPVMDQLPLERLQRALLRELNGEDASERLYQLSRDSYWGNFVDKAHLRLKQNRER